MPTLPSKDYDHCLALLRAALGDFDPKKPLSTVLKGVPEFGKFEWMLTIIGLEIDLRVDIPESLADNLKRRTDEFAQLVSQLPKVDSPGYTLECLGMVAQALLSLEPDSASEGAPPKARAHKAPAKGAKTPRAASIEAKRSSKATTKADDSAQKRPARRAPAKRRGTAPKKR